MIAIAYNNAAGGFSEFELRLPNSPEREAGLTYAAGKEWTYPGAVLQSAAAYSQDGRTVVFFDSYFGRGRVGYRSSNVTVPNSNPWGGAVDGTEGYEIRHAGYGPPHVPARVPAPHVLFSRLDHSGHGLSVRKIWHIYQGLNQLTDTPGLFPIYVPSNETIYFVPVDADDTLRRMNADDRNSRNEAIAHQFQGGHIRALAVTQNRSVSRFDFDVGSDELLVSVYFPSQGKSTIFACYHSAKGFHPHTRFDVSADWVSVAGTGIFGSGTRIVYNQGQNILLWDNRDGNSYPIYTWVALTPTDFKSTPIGPFHQSALGSGIAISADVPR